MPEDRWQVFAACEMDKMWDPTSLNLGPDLLDVLPSKSVDLVMHNPLGFDFAHQHFEERRAVKFELRLPAGPHRLTIATDGDSPGRDAAHALAERAHALGWQVSLLPAPEGRDWNDILTMKGDAA